MEKLIKIGLGLSLLWYAVLRGAKGLVVAVRDYSFRNIDLTNGTVSLNLNFLIKNPLIVGLTLRGIQGDVYIQGQQAGYVNTTVDYYLSGGKTHIIPVVVNLTMADTLKAALLNIQSGDIRTLTVSFDGKIYVGDYNIGIPIQINLDYNDLMQ